MEMALAIGYDFLISFGILSASAIVAMLFIGFIAGLIGIMEKGLRFLGRFL